MAGRNSVRTNSLTVSHSFQTNSRLWSWTLIAVAVWLFTEREAPGQESLRVSMAGDLAAETRRQEAETIGYYNLLLGPTAWRFSSGLGFEFNDNVRIQSQNPEADFITRPNLSAQMNWPVTAQNSLNLSLGAGYSIYALHSDLDQLYVNPGSGIAFNLYIGDFVINVHDRADHHSRTPTKPKTPPETTTPRCWKTRPASVPYGT